MMDVCTYRKKVVLLIRLYYTQECVEVFLDPELLETLLVIIVAWKHVSLCHELFSCILSKYGSKPIEHESCTVDLLDFIRVEWVYAVHAD